MVLCLDGTGFVADADENLFAGNNAGGSYDPSSGTACQNIFLGCNSGLSITEGDDNIFLGQSSGHDNTTGSYNNFFGTSAGYYNISGIQNVYIGKDAGYCNNTGDNNIAIGRDALRCARPTSSDESLKGTLLLVSLLVHV